MVNGKYLSLLIRMHFYGKTKILKIHFQIYKPITPYSLTFVKNEIFTDRLKLGIESC